MKCKNSDTYFVEKIFSCFLKYEDRCSVHLDGS